MDLGVAELLHLHDSNCRRLRLHILVYVARALRLSRCNRKAYGHFFVHRRLNLLHASRTFRECVGRRPACPCVEWQVCAASNALPYLIAVAARAGTVKGTCSYSVIGDVTDRSVSLRPIETCRPLRTNGREAQTPLAVLQHARAANHGHERIGRTNVSDANRTEPRATYPPLRHHQPRACRNGRS